ncbi:MAG: class I SAM-dependent methyltransferase [Pirellulales bacterium]|nr:class I SAM-dependent methyltransferase [Pirellulales bacterium]
MTFPCEHSLSGHRPPGSFRDPSGYVFWREDRVFRAVSEDCLQIIGRLREAGLLSQLARGQMIVATEVVEDNALCQTLAAEHAGYDHFLEHEPLPAITYPYEWSVSMLADAGVHTIDLQLQLLESGYSLKDATAYNVQFVHGRPVFIDLGSIEQPQRLDIWFALGQFTQMFTLPLLLCRHYGWDPRSYFLANLGGRTVQQALRGLGWFGRWRPRVLWDVTLPALLTGWSDRRARPRQDRVERRKTDTTSQVFNLRRLRRKIRKLSAGYSPRGVWSQYTRLCGYDEHAENAKKALVAEFLESTRPRRVLDLGCNTGDYSRLAAGCGAEVLALDSDHDTIEVLYRQLRKAPASITPMVADLCNPSPGIGYLNRERAPFLGRVEADCVLALALAHHLLISGNLPATAVRDLMLEMTRRDLVLEFVPRGDQMFQRLMRFRVDLFGDWTLPNCRHLFTQRFELLRESPVPGTNRTLLFLRRRDCPLAE